MTRSNCIGVGTGEGGSWGGGGGSPFFAKLHITIFKALFLFCLPRFFMSLAPPLPLTMCFRRHWADSDTFSPQWLKVVQKSGNLLHIKISANFVPFFFIFPYIICGSIWYEQLPGVLFLINLLLNSSAVQQQWFLTIKKTTLRHCMTLMKMFKGISEDT